MRYFLDTWALVKVYHKEAGTVKVLNIYMCGKLRYHNYYSQGIAKGRNLDAKCLRF